VEFEDGRQKSFPADEIKELVPAGEEPEIPEELKELEE